MGAPVAVVAGAAGGIGGKTAGLLLKEGYRVIALDIDETHLPGVEPVVLDITDRAAVGGFVESLSRQGTRVDALVVSAAVHNTHPVRFLTDDVVDHVLDVNLASHIKLVRDFLPLIPRGGAVVGISSIAACVGVPMSSLYSASKAGLEGFYESLRNEMRPRGIRVSVVHPGNVNTGFNETGNTWDPSEDRPTGALYEKVVSRIDSRYGIDPGVVARTVLKVLGKKRPRFCYVVGMNARKANWARKLLGRDLAIKLMGMYFGFTGKGE